MSAEGRVMVVCAVLVAQAITVWMLERRSRRTGPPLRLVR